MGPKNRKAVAERLLAASERSFSGMRRPDVIVSPEVIEGLREALARAGGLLIIPLTEVVEVFGLHEAYKDSDRATLLASSLSRKLGNDISVGTREMGRYLTFRLKRFIMNK
jgi:hypothetical protein